MLSGINTDTVQLLALFTVCGVEDCTIVFAIAQFPLQGAFRVLDGDLFGGVGGIII